MKYDIFISYRRDGGYETAKHLFDLLTRDGYTVSFDIDTLRNGDFDKTLLNRIDECTDFILVLDAHAFDRTLDPSFPKVNDWLFQELSHALKQNKNIIPIMLSGFNFPDNLPDEIKKVQRKNGPKYDKYYFDEFYKKLKTDFFETPVPISSISNAPITFVLKITVDETSMLYIDNREIRKIKQGKPAIIDTLKFGYKYDIRLNNLAIKDEDYIIEYEVPDKKESDSIFVEFKKLRKERIKKQKEISFKKKKEKEQQNTFIHNITNKLYQICEEKYDWYDTISSNTIRVKRGKKYGFLDFKGIEIIPCVLADAKNYEGNFAYISNGIKWGIIDQSGEQVIKFICDEPAWIKDGYTVLIQNERQTLVNLLFPEKRLGTFDNVIRTEFQNRFVVKDQDNYSIIDENGIVLNGNTFDKYYSNQLEELYLGKGYISFPLIVSTKRVKSWIKEIEDINIDETSGFGLINQNGEYIIPCKMNSVIPIDSDWRPNQYYKIELDSKYGIYDTKSNSFSIPPIYKSLTRIFAISQQIDAEMWCACNSNSKWGCINYDNNELITFIYDYCLERSSYENWASLSSGSKVNLENVGFIKFLSDDNIQWNQNGDIELVSDFVNYKQYIIDYYNFLSNDKLIAHEHCLINFPFLYTYSLLQKQFRIRLMRPNEFIPFSIIRRIYANTYYTDYSNLLKHPLVSPLENKNNVKEIYYDVCGKLYGIEEANERVKELMTCNKYEHIIHFFSHYLKTKYSSSEQLLQSAKTCGNNKVLSPVISIISTESSDNEYKALTEEINRTKELFSQNGFICKSKETTIVLLNDSIYKNEEVISEINNRIITPHNVIFIGSSMSLNENDSFQLEWWAMSQTFYETSNVIADKNILVLNIFAFLNGWHVASPHLFSNPFGWFFNLI